MSEWSANLDDPSVGFISNVSDDHDTVLVAFSGLHLKTGFTITPFEFFNVIKDHDVGKVFVRDVAQAWYHHGVPGLGDSITEVASSLGGLLEGRRRTVLLGHSCGGYAALLFGALLGADDVIATSPQTFVSRRLRWYYRDRRWSDRMNVMRASPTAQPEYFDLKGVLRSASPDTRIQVHYSAKHRHDHKHALRLRNVPQLSLVPHKEPTHGLVKVMRDSGMLQSVLDDVIGTPADP